MKIQQTALSKTDKKGEVELNDLVFNVEYNEGLVHQVITSFLTNRRAGTKCNKNRAAVRGGGAKPWRQKGTGRARAGTRSSPLWRSGGKTFTGQAVYSNKVNKKMFRGAMRCILSEFARQGNIVVVDNIELKDHKTKSFLALTQDKGLDTGTVLSHDISVDLYLATRNLNKVVLTDPYYVDPYTLYRSEKLIFTKEAIQLIEERLS